MCWPDQKGKDGSNFFVKKLEGQKKGRSFPSFFFFQSLFLPVLFFHSLLDWNIKEDGKNNHLYFNCINILQMSHNEKHKNNLSLWIVTNNQSWFLLDHFLSWISRSPITSSSVVLDIKQCCCYLLVPGADLSVEVQSLLSFLKLASVQQVGTDHHAGATFSRLTVDGGDVLLIFAQPMIQVLAERLYQLQLRGVVVLERVLSHWQRPEQSCEIHHRPDGQQHSCSDLITFI